MSSITWIIICVIVLAVGLLVWLHSSQEYRRESHWKRGTESKRI